LEIIKKGKCVRKKLLFVNSCVNRETSRTYRLAKELVFALNKSNDFEVKELVLEEESIQPLTSESLNRRTALLKKGELSDKTFMYANEFRDADCIVISAPYWDFGFPAMLKIYIEAISVSSVVYKYGEGGRPVGLCRAEKLYYVTTRGGYIGDEKDLGFGTMVQLGGFYGINEIKCISADGFDVPVNDRDAILKKAIEGLPNNA